ncbi:MAG: hypothetical protein GC184_08615 [Rhizobiales bacterium]|nr:hypothetical protein [Hyphomicrobiales bacterium]
MNTKELLLSVLMREPATGYDIKKILANEVSQILDVSLSNLYPALNELAAEGLVTFEKIEQDNRPNKKVYAITPEGRAACIKALMEAEPRHSLRSEFLFILIFASFLPRSRVEELIDNRLKEFELILEKIDRKEAEAPHGPLTAGERFSIGIGRATIEAQRQYILAHRSWLLRESPEAPDYKVALKMAASQ